MENLQLTTAVPVATQLKQKISGLEPTWSAETMEGLGYLSVVEYLSNMSSALGFPGTKTTDLNKQKKKMVSKEKIISCIGSTL